jgi:hypothetical protein
VTLLHHLLKQNLPPRGRIRAPVEHTHVAGAISPASCSLRTPLPHLPRLARGQPSSSATVGCALLSCAPSGGTCGSISITRCTILPCAQIPSALALEMRQEAGCPDKATPRPVSALQAGARAQIGSACTRRCRGTTRKFSSASRGSQQSWTWVRPMGEDTLPPFPTLPPSTPLVFSMQVSPTFLLEVVVASVFSSFSSSLCLHAPLSSPPAYSSPPIHLSIYLYTCPSLSLKRMTKPNLSQRVQDDGQRRDSACQPRCSTIQQRHGRIWAELAKVRFLSSTTTPPPTPRDQYHFSPPKLRHHHSFLGS